MTIANLRIRRYCGGVHRLTGRNGRKAEKLGGEDSAPCHLSTRQHRKCWQSDETHTSGSQGLRAPFSYRQELAHEI